MSKVSVPYEYRASVTSKGQVTIPAEVRRALGTCAGEQLIFEVRDDGTVTVRRPTYPTLASLTGAAGTLPAGSTYDDSDIPAIVGDEIARSYRRKIASGDA